MTSSKNSDLILVGVISAAHGIQGNVLIKSFTSPITNIIKMKLINEQREEVKLALIRQTPKGDLICKFNNVADRTTAEELKHYKIFCLHSTLPNLEEEEFYVSNLTNLKIVDNKLNSLGSIHGIYNFGAGDLIEVKFHNEKTELFPFTKEFFPIITSEYAILENYKD